MYSNIYINPAVLKLRNEYERMENEHPLNKY